VKRSDVAGILVAAGASTRVGGGTPKQFVNLGGRPMFLAALDCLTAVSGEIVVVVPRDRVEETSREIDRRRALGDLPAGTRPTVVAGGARRQDSVASGLAGLADGPRVVLVHDAARPFASSDLAGRVAAAALGVGAAVPVVPVGDTVKRVSNDGADRVLETIDRARLRFAQTPQGFRREVLEAAYAALGDAEITDEAQAVELAGHDVAIVDGEPGNVKVTSARDLELATLRAGRRLGLPAGVRIGTGTDCHRLEGGRPLVLGGVAVPFEKGLAGHSDADVLTHAICDALLGAVSAGDIGRHFPPGDPAYLGVSSLILLERVVGIVRETGHEVSSVDATVIAEAPRLSPYIEAMRGNLALVLEVAPAAVSVKATTTEGTGPEGEGVAMTAHAVALVRRRVP